jgi:predicted dehydrogenase
MLTLSGRPGVWRACEIATGLGADTAARQPAPGAFFVPFLNRRWDSDHLTVGRLVAREALATVLRYESRFERWAILNKSGA